MYNMVNTDVICPSCGEGRMIREEPKVIKSNTETYAYLCPYCGFVHTAKSDEDMKGWIKSLAKQDEILKEEDPVDIHDEISQGFARIENVIREESANIAEIVRQAVKRIELWPSTYSTLEIASKKLNKSIPELVDIAVRIVYLGIDQ